MKTLATVLALVLASAPVASAQGPLIPHSTRVQAALRDSAPRDVVLIPAPANLLEESRAIILDDGERRQRARRGAVIGMIGGAAVGIAIALTSGKEGCEGFCVFKSNQTTMALGLGALGALLGGVVGGAIGYNTGQ